MPRRCGDAITHAQAEDDSEQRSSSGPASPGSRPQHTHSPYTFPTQHGSEGTHYPNSCVLPIEPPPPGLLPPFENDTDGRRTLFPAGLLFHPFCHQDDRQVTSPQLSRFVSAQLHKALHRLHFEALPCFCSIALHEYARHHGHPLGLQSFITFCTLGPLKKIHFFAGPV